MDKIKLVIWDLDETFWEGTLSEGQITALPENISIVKELTERGIINSIVSKNDFESVRMKLEELNIWEYFIFPIISWTPKGEAVRGIIDNCQLRNENVLFIDDNHSNIKEVEFYNDKINTAFPDFISEILLHPSFKGKNDSELSRLKQYKILEKKHNERTHYFDNTSFLESSNIKVTYIEDISPLKDRIYELIERTNQLNYTKKRLSEEEVGKLIGDSALEHRAIHVSDKFGDYGIVGYYCFDKLNNRLEHFVFSCRILNLGVEQFIYASLKFPEINVIPEVSTILDKTSPHWITVNENLENKDSSNYIAKVLFKGGCDLEQMLHYIGGLYNLNIIQETNYAGKNNVPIHNDHTQVLVNSFSLNEKDLNYIESTLPFFDDYTHETEIIKNNFDVCIFSVLMDYTQDLYKHKEKGFIIPFGGYNTSNLTDKSQHSKIIDKFSKNNAIGFTADFLDNFSEEYEYIGQESPDRFKENLAIIRSKVDHNIPIIFINGSEVVDDFSQEKTATERHIEMNRILSEFVKNNNNCYILDVRKCIKSRSDVTDNIRHYKREKYRDLSILLMGLLYEKRILKKGFTRFILESLKNRIRPFLKK